MWLKTKSLNLLLETMPPLHDISLCVCVLFLFFMVPCLFLGFSFLFVRQFTYFALLNNIFFIEANLCSDCMLVIGFASIFSALYFV